ncbi:UNVERIFIED_CONTAM: hypothetical protein GTU68_043505, partial [Idotea baltica]|nr:hypothetical protein [Idotea baltica]
TKLYKTLEAIIGTDVSLAASLLKKGKLVAIPTETVYGLAGNAFNKDAIIAIFEAKNRPRFNPLIIHTHSLEKVKEYVKELPEAALKLAEAHWPGPLTLLLSKHDRISDLVTAGSPRVAIRIPNHPLTLSVLEQCDFPVAAPSANPFGYISPTTSDHVFQQLGSKIPYILNGGPCQVGIESTIIGFEEDRPRIYRLGGMALNEIEEMIGKILTDVKTNEDLPQTSGRLKSHYAPGTPLILGKIEELLEKTNSKRVGVLAFQQTYSSSKIAKQIVLSPNGNINEAAKNLFAAMRNLDEKRLEIIFAELLPETGLGNAINDRLKRAQALNKNPNQ